MHPQVSGAEEQDLHIRGAGAFESPQTLDGFVRFVRDKVEKVDAQAVLTLVPKEAIGFPRVRPFCTLFHFRFGLGTFCACAFVSM